MFYINQHIVFQCCMQLWVYVPAGAKEGMFPKVSGNPTLKLIFTVLLTPNALFSLTTEKWATTCNTE